MALGFIIVLSILLLIIPLATSTKTHGATLKDIKWTKSMITVCWKMNETQYASTKEGRVITEKAVHSTWEQHIDVRFDFVGLCSVFEDTCGIKADFYIIVDDGGAFVSPEGGDQIEHMGLNFYFKITPFDSIILSCKGNNDMCIYLTAVHEFGHALGLIHEHGRPDAPPCYGRENMSGTQLLTEYDPDSVMNYCHIYEKLISYENILSKKDIESIQKLYPRNDTAMNMTMPTYPSGCIRKKSIDE